MSDYDNETELAVVAEQSMVATLQKGEIDGQIATAKKYPRSVVRFRKEALEMVTLTEKVAESCIYALPRDGKTIEGPSARFAEVVASAWGNCRAGARVVSDQGDFVTAQGVFHDLERNVAITYEVQRRITNKSGKRFGADMIGVTANAACSIALRNSILKGVPKAFWDDLYEAARQVIRGDFKTLANRRADTLAKFQGYGMSKEEVCATLAVGGVEDIGLDELVLLRGMLTALREGDTTPDQLIAGTSSTNKPKVSLPEPKNTPQGGTVETKAESLPQNEGKSPSPTAALYGEAVERVEELKQSAEKKPAPKENGYGHSTFASEGEKKFILAKAESAGVTREAVMEECGITDFDRLTTHGFNAMKNVIQSLQAR